MAAVTGIDYQGIKGLRLKTMFWLYVIVDDRRHVEIGENRFQKVLAEPTVWHDYFEKI
jgi:hypothetical protein